MAGIMQAFCNAEEKVNFHSQGGGFLARSTLVQCYLFKYPS